MIDTIKGYVNLKQYSKRDFTAFIEKGSKKIKDNRYTIAFYLSNFRITLKFDNNDRPLVLYFNGSLAKFYNGNNLMNFDWDDVGFAIQMLSDNLNVDMSKAILTRVDVGINFEVNYSVHQYISCLVAFPRLQTMRFKDSITFFTRSDYKSLIFYDKISEIKKRDKKTYTSISNSKTKKHILRYEIQLKKRLKNRLGKDQILVKDLSCDTIQNKLVEIWSKSYSKVQKLSFDMDPIYLLHNHSGLYKYLAFHGVDKLGYDRLSNTISELQFDIKNPLVKRSKMKSTIRKLLKNVNENTLDKNLVKELDIKIKNIKDES